MEGKNNNNKRVRNTKQFVGAINGKGREANQKKKKRKNEEQRSNVFICLHSMIANGNANG